MEENRQTIFRQKTLDRISSPEQLTDYLRVTNPGIWMVLAAVILLLAGMLVWMSVGTLETTAPAHVVVQNHTAQVIPDGSGMLEAGMPLHVASQEFVIATAEVDEYGRTTGRAEVSLPDGTYEGTVVVEKLRPIEFLFSSR